MQGLKVLIFSGIIFIALTTQAQTNFLKGYYVTLKNDTIHGFIEHLSDNGNSQKCVYKATLSDKPTSFSSTEIKGFAILNQDFYESYTYRLKKSTEPVQGFFRVLIKGKLTLLRIDERYFVKTDSGKVVEISKYSAEDRKKMNSFGIGMLKVLTKDCAPNTSVERLYRSDSPNFIEFFRTYNMSCSTGSTFEAKRIKRKLHFYPGVQVGLLYSSIELQNELNDFNLNYDAAFTLGGNVSVFIPRIPEDVRFLLEVTGGKYNQYAFLSQGSVNNDLFIQYSFLRTSAFVRLGHNHFFIDAGYQLRYVFNQKSTWREEHMEGNQVFTYNNSVEPFQSYNGGFLLGLGAQFKISNVPVQSSFRFTKSKTSVQAYRPVFQNLELVISVQLTH